MCKQIEIDCNISLQWRWRRGLFALSFVVKRESEVDAEEELEPCSYQDVLGCIPHYMYIFGLRGLGFS